MLKIAGFLLLMIIHSCGSKLLALKSNITVTFSFLTALLITTCFTGTHQLLWESRASAEAGKCKCVCGHKGVKDQLLNYKQKKNANTRYFKIYLFLNEMPIARTLTLQTSKFTYPFTCSVKDKLSSNTNV